MNKFIHKVIKWLEDPESVSQEEREENRVEDPGSCSAAQAAYYYSAAAALTASAAANAAYFAAENNPELATKWVNKYFEVTGEDKQDYLDAIEVEKVGSKKEPVSVYVKEYKGLSVPSGATHYSEDGEKITFYRVGAPRVERYSKPLCAADDPWSSCLSNPTNELPKIEEEKVFTDTNKELSERVEVIARNGNDGEHYAELENNKSKYHREIKKGVFVDVYDVLSAFEVVNPAMQHALKKMLAPGKRGAKDTVQDMQEAIQSIERAIELEGE